MSEKEITVYIVDDHPIVRRGISELIDTTSGLTVIGQAENGQIAVNEVLELQPDVVLMDLEMPVLDGVQALTAIKQSGSHAAVLILTSFGTDDKVFPAIKAGASGYLIKDSSPEELIGSIRKVHKGEISLHPLIAQRVVNEISSGPSDSTGETLSSREHDVLKLIAKGLDNQQISDELSISLPTVYTHVSNILAKLHLANRTQAALFALKSGFASLDD